MLLVAFERGAGSTRSIFSKTKIGFFQFTSRTHQSLKMHDVYYISVILIQVILFGLIILSNENLVSDKKILMKIWF